MRKWSGWVAVGLGTLGVPAVGWACGALPEGQWGLAAEQPLADAVGAVVDGPLAFQVDCVAGSDVLADAICSNTDSLLAVELSEMGSDAPSIVGTTQPFGDVQVFLPDTALNPHATYAVQVWLREGVQTFEGASDRRSLTFTTGEASLSAPQATNLVLGSERYQARVADCGGTRYVGDMAEQALAPDQVCPSGWGDCVADGTQEQVRLAVHLDGFSGGAGTDGYALRLLVTDAVPGRIDSLPLEVVDDAYPEVSHDLRIGDAVHVPLGESGSLAVDLLRPEREDGDETVCLRVLAVDAAGQKVAPEPVCKTYDAWVAEAVDAPAASDVSSVPTWGDDTAPGTDAGVVAVDGGGVEGRDFSLGNDDLVDDRGCAVVPAAERTLSLWWLAVFVLPLRAHRQRMHRPSKDA